MVDAEKLGRGAGVRVSLLGLPFRITLPGMRAVEKLIQQDFVEAVRVLVEAQTARGWSSFG